MQFTKLFNSILDSTIWQEPLQTKIVWITMLAMVDRTGEVHASVPGLAKRAGVSLSECEEALRCLKSPDPYSRTKDHEGRRVRDIDGGWELLNHAKYRALLSAEERREYNRKKQAEYRAVKKPRVNDMSMTVNDNVSNAHITDAESEAEAIIPPNPQGGLILEIEEVRKPDPEQIAVGKLLGRRESTKWSPEEIKLLKAIKPIHPDDMVLMAKFYGADIPSDKDYRRTSLQRLLKHWSGELDKARIFSAGQ
jgi:hypothetical protein